MKLYLSDADLDLVIACLGNIPMFEAIERRNELRAKLEKARASKGRSPVVGAINVTGTISEFAEVTNLSPTSYLASYLIKLTRFPLLGNNELRFFVDRDTMLATLRKAEAPFGVMEAAKALPHFPAPNPGLLNDRNALGQTEEEFWVATDAMLERV